MEVIGVGPSLRAWTLLPPLPCSVASIHHSPRPSHCPLLPGQLGACVPVRQVTALPLPCSSRPSSPASSYGAATPTTRTSARPRRGPPWMAPSVRRARYLGLGAVAGLCGSRGAPAPPGVSVRSPPRTQVHTLPPTPQLLAYSHFTDEKNEAQAGRRRNLGSQSGVREDSRCPACPPRPTTLFLPHMR